MLLRWFEHKQVYQPSSRHVSQPTDLGVPAEDVTFTTSDGVALNGWFFSSQPTHPRARWVILYAHGNAGNISHRLGVCEALLETGPAVFIFDYRGYGESAGRPNEEGTYLDAQAAHLWLVDRGFTPHHIVALGKSLGGAVAAELALREPLGGLILQNTFTSIPDVGADIFPFLPVRTLARIRYDTAAKLPRVHVPVLILHSREDTMMPFRHAETNFAAANEPKQLTELRGDHNDTFDRSRDTFVSAIDGFLRALQKKSS
jgi:hypothetical protein